MTTTKTFTPLSVRSGRRPRAFLDLEEGVPGYMFPLLSDWLLETSLIRRDTAIMGGTYHFRQSGREMLLALKMTSSSVSEFREKLRRDPDLFLDVVDYVLDASVTDPTRVQDVDWQGLERILSKGRSAWMVAPTRDALIRRLPEETQAALEEALSTGDAAAQHLADAWRDGWSRTPNATSSYQSGIMAIESAMRSIVSPDDPKATLGTMLSAVKDKPSKWQTRFDGDDAAGVVALEQVLRAVWEAHVRHGEDEYASVTIEQARDVCHLALLVVNLANSRGLARTER